MPNFNLQINNKHQKSKPRPWSLMLVIWCLIVTAGFFFASVQSVDAAVIKRPPNNLGLVGYWSMDEGVGNSVSDLSGNGNDGTINGDPEWVNGRFGNALDFDHLNSESVEIPSSSSLEISDVITVSAWVRLESDSGNGRKVVTKFFGGSSNDKHYVLEVDPGNVLAAIDDNDAEVVGDEVPLNEWHFIAFTYDGSVLRIYNNGEETGSTMYSSAISTDSNPLLIGNNGNSGGGTGSDSNRNFDGTIDDVRIYNRALSDTEIKDLYENSSHTTLNTTDTNRFTDNLVSHWTFDGPHMTSATATDVYGDYDGTRNGPITSRGILGQALDFDGTDDYVRVPTDSAVGGEAALTRTAWIYPTAAGDREILDRHRSNRELRLGGSEGSQIVRACMEGNTFYCSESTPGDVVLNKWQHVAMRYDDNGDRKVDIFINGQEVTYTQQPTLGGTLVDDSGQDLWIGVRSDSAGTSPSDRYFQGKIDDVRLYNSALSDETIQAVYVNTKPDKVNASQNSKLTDGLVGMWSFDGPSVSDSTVTDDSGNGNDGTINGDAKPVIGKIGQAFEFDGTGDVLNLGDTDFAAGEAEITVAAWVNLDRENTGSDQAVVSRGTDGSNDPWELRESGGNIHWGWWDGVWNTVTTPPSVGSWVFYVGVFDDNTMYLYEDGVQVASGTGPGTIANTTGIRATIGARDQNGSFSRETKGSIDQVRIYNRALSADEVSRLYHLGR